MAGSATRQGDGPPCPAVHGGHASAAALASLLPPLQAFVIDSGVFKPSEEGNDFNALSWWRSDGAGHLAILCCGEQCNLKRGAPTISLLLAVCFLVSR